MKQEYSTYYCTSMDHIADMDRKLQFSMCTMHSPIMQIKLRTLRRRARLLYLPAYVADYKFGEQFNAHGERRPQRFQAVVSGMDPTSIAAERHYSPHKVQLHNKIALLTLTKSVTHSRQLSIPDPSTAIGGAVH